MIDTNPAKPPRDLTVIRRATIVAGIGFAAVILIRLYVVSAALRHEAIEDAERNLTSISKITAEQTAQTFSAVDILTRSIQQVAMHPSLPDQATLRARATTAQFQAALVGWQTLLPQVEAATVIDAAGDVLSNTRQFPFPPLNIADSPFFAALKSDPDRGLVVSDAALSSLAGHWVTYLARALKDDQGRFAGGVLVAIPISYFERYFSAIDVGPETSAALDSSQGRLIAGWPRNEDAIGKVLPGASGHPRGPEPGETAINVIIGVDHVLRRVATTRLRIQGAPLFIAVSRSESAILKPWRVEALWIFVSALIGVAILVLLGWFLVRALRDEEAWHIAAVERETQLSRQAAELAAARDLAQTANRARGDFLANISHELRTPLNAILGFSEILEKELFGPLGDPRYREFVLDIHGSGTHLLEIISNILDLTKIDAGKLQLDEREVDVVDLMRLCARLVEDSARGAAVTLEPRLGAPLVLWADPTRLKQILLNLLSNAIKFTPSGGVVTLTAGQAGDGYFLRVSDTGIGMSSEDLKEAMQPFRQIDSSLARRYQGTGLGLPLTKSLVELHGGALEIRSKVGQGTAATVKLPQSRVVERRVTAPGL